MRSEQLGVVYFYIVYLAIGPFCEPADPGVFDVYGKIRCIADIVLVDTRQWAKTVMVANFKHMITYDLLM